MVLYSVAPGKAYYAIRFSDIPAEYILGGVCFCCARRGPVDRLRLERRWGAIAWIVDIDRHLRCLECGNRTANRFAVVGRLITENKNTKGTPSHV